MARVRSKTVMIDLPSGVSVEGTCKVRVDWESARLLCESGMPRAEVAALFKVTKRALEIRAKQERWLTPSRIESLKKEMAAKQREVFDRTGTAKPLVEIKAALWEERSERWKEKMAGIVDESLSKVSKKAIRGMISEAKDLKTVMEVARTLTGEAKAEDDAPKLAVNIGFLRSGFVPTPVDVVDV